MSAIRKRITIHAGGTPEGVTNALYTKPEGVPEDAVIVDVQMRTYEDVLLGGSTLVSSSLEITLEWPA